MEAKEWHQIKMSNRFTSLEIFDNNVVTSRTRVWENIRENIKLYPKIV
jgi:hypothetical protein